MRRRSQLTYALAAAAIIAVAVCVFLAQSAAGQSAPVEAQLARWLDSTARGYLAHRGAVIAQIHTRTQAEERRALVRETVLRLIGGLPDKRGPLHTKIVGTLREQGFLVERIVYDSLPDFHVTADLYLPDQGPDQGKPPYPAVIYTPGHSPEGKLEAWLFASNMARNGIAVLAYDPIGEGERMLYFDPATGASLAGHPTGQHSEASLQPTLVGENISRYFVWDAMRGIDYLASRPDIDPKRIGAFGCSGGGTVTAYLTVLDPRVSVAGVACYITSFGPLLSTIGPQEAEQTIPDFIKDGLGFADWVETAAPRPYTIISTTEDMFPFAGAQQSYEESRRIYSLYGAKDHLQWITGPGRHGNLRPIESQIIGFFLHWLKSGAEQKTGKPAIVLLPEPPAQDLLCTRTGQVSTSLGGATVYSLNRASAVLPPIEKPFTSPSQLVRFREHLIEQVRTVGAIGALPGSPPMQVTATSTEQKPGYRIEDVEFPSVTGINLSGRLAIPDDPGKKPAVLLLSPQPTSETDLNRLATSGHIVFAPELLPGDKDAEEQKSALLGPYYLLTLRAFLVGQTLVGLRTDDVLRAADWLVSRPDVDAAHLDAEGAGPMGIVLLHAVLLDPRIRSITLDRTLVNFRMAIDQPITRGLAQSVIPGVLRHYDLDELAMAISPRPILIVDPLDAEGHDISAGVFHERYAWVFTSDRNLHQADRLHVDTRAAAISQAPVQP